jgi:hypothetical protein
MSGAGRSRTPVTRAAHLFKQAFKGLMTRADIDIGLYAFEWGELVRILGGFGRDGQVTPPA